MRDSQTHQKTRNALIPGGNSGASARECRRELKQRRQRTENTRTQTIFTELENSSEVTRSTFLSTLARSSPQHPPGALPRALTSSALTPNPGTRDSLASPDEPRPASTSKVAESGRPPGAVTSPITRAGSPRNRGDRSTHGHRLRVRHHPAPGRTDHARAQRTRHRRGNRFTVTPTRQASRRRGAPCHNSCRRRGDRVAANQAASERAGRATGRVTGGDSTACQRSGRRPPLSRPHPSQTRAPGARHRPAGRRSASGCERASNRPERAQARQRRAPRRTQGRGGQGTPQGSPEGE